MVSNKRGALRKITASALLCAWIVVSYAPATWAVGSPNPNQSGTTGLQGTISSPPPSRAATITIPASGATFTSTPTSVSGLCATGLLVKIFSNNIFVGSTQCTNGSYSLQVDLFGGQNNLVAKVFDALDQAGPDSNTVSVNFQDGQFAAFNQRISLTSTLAKNGANVGSQLSWPIVLSGGTGPYALSIDWGDGTSTDLKSIAFAGTINITHTYKKAGIYRVVVKATDSTGAAAFLQLVGVGNGTVSQASNGKKVSASNPTGTATDSTNAEGNNVRYIYIWWPVLLIVPFIIATFWVGKRYAVLALHKKIEQEAKMYESEIQR